MFTGIIEDLGVIKSIKNMASGIKLTVSSNNLASNLKIGDSISINGVCSTVTELNNNEFSVEYSSETLLKTYINSYQLENRVNLELALLPTTRMGGHFVQGHVDEVGKILSIKSDNEFKIITIKASSEFAKYLIPKGSIAIDGISLTINYINQDLQFSVYIIPETLKNTVLSDKNKDDFVHLEYDILGKYIYNFVKQDQKINKDQEFFAKLKNLGYIN